MAPVPASVPSVAARLRVAGFRYHPAIGGAEQYARRLVKEFGDRLSVDVVTLLTTNSTDWLRVLVHGARDSEESFEVDGRTVRALARWPAPTRRLLRLLAPLYHVPAGPAPSLMAKILSRRLEDAVQQADVVHNFFMGREAFSLGLMLAAHRARRPFVFTPLRHQRPLGWSSPAFRALYRSADALIALTATEADWLMAHGAPRERTHVMGIGPLCNREASPEAARLMLRTDRKIVLFLGQLHEYKGFRVLLEAARRLAGRTDFQVVLAGPDVRGHARIFRSAGPHVTYLATVDDALRDSLLQACTVLCVPSSRESFGIVVVDAWTCGKPVIGGPAAATRELIDDGVDGWAVPQDPARVAQCLERLLDDEALGRRMGAHGKRKVDTRFNWKTIADAHLDIYADVQARRKQRS